MTEQTVDSSAEPAARQSRPWFAWALMIAGDGIAVWRGYLCASWYREWQHDRVFDPGVADAAWQQTLREGALVAGGLAIAALGVLLFMRAQRARPRDVAAGDAS